MQEHNNIILNDQELINLSDLELKKQVLEYAKKSKSENTIKAYRTDWQIFVEWCNEKNKQSYPAIPDTIMMFISDIAANSTRKLSTIQRYLSTVSAVHELNNVANPVKNYQVKQVLDGIRREKTVKRTSKKPLLLTHIQQICQLLNEKDDIISCRDHALLLVSYTTGLRQSEVLALNWEDLEYVNDKGFIAAINKSKTDQVGTGKIKTIEYGTGLTCPVTALRIWQNCSNICEGAIFRSFTPKGAIKNKRLGSRGHRNIIKKLIRAIGLNSDNYSTHSTRSGSTTQFAENGATLKDLQNHGDWKSLTMPLYYQKQVRQFTDKSKKIGL